MHLDLEKIVCAIDQGIVNHRKGEYTRTIASGGKRPYGPGIDPRGTVA